MKGFIIFNRENGNLIYSKYFNEEREFSKEVNYKNMVFDNGKPELIAKQFH